MRSIVGPHGRRFAVLPLCVVFSAAIVTTVAFSNPAVADARIVSVTTDRLDVKVDAVSVGDTRLKEVGRSDTSLFVEVGKEGEAFTCRQSLRFRLSDGRETSKDIDLCAENYQVKVALEGAAKVERRRIMVRADDESPIRSVQIDGSPVAIDRRQGGAVVLEIAGDPANGGVIECERDIRLVLDSGKVVERKTDLCADDIITLALDDPADEAVSANGRRHVRPAIPSDSGPAAPPVGRQVQGPPEAPDTAKAAPSGQEERPAADGTAAPETGAAAVDVPAPTAIPNRYDGKAWRTDVVGNAVQLIYGVTGTDDVAFSASCALGSSAAEIVLAETIEGLAEGAPVDVMLAALDVRRQYQARGSSSAGETGRVFPVIEIPIADPIWNALVRGEDLSVAIDGAWRYTVSLSGSAGPVRRFMQGCAPTPQIVEGPSTTYPPTYPATEPSMAGPGCADEGFIRSIPSDRPTSIVFRNERNQSVVVNWIDFDGRRRIQAELAPGMQITQPTVVGHPWLVSTPAGRCIGIYVAADEQQVVTLAPTRREAPTLALPAPVSPAPFSPEPMLPFGSVSANYSCEDGSMITVTIDNNRHVAVVHEIGLMPVTLPDRSAGPELDYGIRGYHLTGVGDQATWVRPGAPPRICRVY